MTVFGCTSHNFELCTIPLEITLTVVKVLVATLNVNIHPIYRVNTPIMLDFT